VEGGMGPWGFGGYARLRGFEGMSSAHSQKVPMQVLTIPTRPGGALGDIVVVELAQCLDTVRDLLATASSLELICYADRRQHLLHQQRIIHAELSFFFDLLPRATNIDARWFALADFFVP